MGTRCCAAPGAARAERACSGSACSGAAVFDQARPAVNAQAELRVREHVMLRRTRAALNTATRQRDTRRTQQAGALAAAHTRAAVYEGGAAGLEPLDEAEGRVEVRGDAGRAQEGGPLKKGRGLCEGRGGEGWDRERTCMQEGCAHRRAAA